MNRTRSARIVLAAIATLIIAGACSRGGGFRESASHGIEYGQYHGPGPWSSYPTDTPAGPPPEMGMPAGGGEDLGMGFDLGSGS